MKLPSYTQGPNRPGTSTPCGGVCVWGGRGDRGRVCLGTLAVSHLPTPSDQPSQSLARPATGIKETRPASPNREPRPRDNETCSPCCSRVSLTPKKGGDYTLRVPGWVTRYVWGSRQGIVRTGVFRPNHTCKPGTGRETRQPAVAMDQSPGS